MSAKPETLQIAPEARAAQTDLDAEASIDRCGALKDFWYVACLSRDLPIGKPIACTILGLPIVLFRDPAGKAVTLRDRCLHRNACLSKGDVFEGKVGCPYHGWTYDGSGRCVEIPSLGPQQRAGVLDAETHEKSGLRMAPDEVGRVRTFETLEQDGQVFVFMGEDASRARRPAVRTAHWGEPGWTCYYMVTDFENGVTNLVENFMDVPHTVYVHRGWFRNKARKPVPATVDRRRGEVLVTYKQEKDVVQGLGRLFSTGHPLVHTDHFFTPNVTRVDYMFGETSGFVIQSQVTPIGPTASRVYTAISYRLPFDLPGRLIGRLLKPLMKWYTTQVILQDVRIMAIQKTGLTSSPGGGIFVSTEADLLHADIEAYRAALLKSTPPPEDAKRDIVFWI